MSLIMDGLARSPGASASRLLRAVPRRRIRLRAGAVRPAPPETDGEPVMTARNGSPVLTRRALRMMQSHRRTAVPVQP